MNFHAVPLEILRFGNLFCPFFTLSFSLSAAFEPILPRSAAAFQMESPMMHALD